MQLPKMEPVHSANLASIGFDTESKALFVQFRNGRVYRYTDPFDESPDLGDSMLWNAYTKMLFADTNGESVGKIFSAEVRGRERFDYSYQESEV